MGDWTKAERLLVGMGSAIFSSLCLASAACTASVWMSSKNKCRETNGGQKKVDDLLLLGGIYMMGFM